MGSNLLRKKVLIRATNHLNLQRNIVALQVARKLLPCYWALKGIFARTRIFFFFFFCFIPFQTVVEDNPVLRHILFAEKWVNFEILAELMSHIYFSAIEG